jgi:hypothetical protein
LIPPLLQVCRKTTLAFLLLCASVAQADQLPPALRPDHAQTSGLGVGLGVGYESGSGVGGHVLYYQQLPHPRWRLALHVGAGSLEPGIGSAFGLNTGGFVAFGKRNRLTLGVHLGIENATTWRLHGVRWAQKPVFGAGVGIGYELMTKRGFMLRLNVGPGFFITPDSPFFGRELRNRWDGNLTLGWKLW